MISRRHIPKVCAVAGMVVAVIGLATCSLRSSAPTISLRVQLPARGSEGGRAPAYSAMDCVAFRFKNASTSDTLSSAQVGGYEPSCLGLDGSITKLATRAKAESGVSIALAGGTYDIGVVGFSAAGGNCADKEVSTLFDSQLGIYGLGESKDVALVPGQTATVNLNYDSGTAVSKTDSCAIAIRTLHPTVNYGLDADFAATTAIYWSDTGSTGFPPGTVSGVPAVPLAAETGQYFVTVDPTAQGDRHAAALFGFELPPGLAAYNSFRLEVRGETGSAFRTGGSCPRPSGYTASLFEIGIYRPGSNFDSSNTLDGLDMFLEGVGVNFDSYKVLNPGNGKYYFQAGVRSTAYAIQGFASCATLKATKIILKLFHN